MLNPNKISEIVNASTEDKLELLRKIASIPSWDADFTSLYRELLADPCPEVRRMCVCAFWDNGGDEDMERLMEIAHNDPDATVKAEACATLGIYVYEGGVLEEISPERYAALRSFLIGRLRDESEDINVRRYALESLGFDDQDDMADMLEWASAQPELPWKASAVFAMGRSGRGKWVPKIVDALDSEHRMVKLAAVKAASEGYCEEATPKLRNLALSQDKDISLEAIWALARAGGPGAMETLDICCQSEDEDTREMAEGAMEEYSILSKTKEEGLGWGTEDEDDEFEEEWDEDDTSYDEDILDDDSEDFPDLDRS